MLKSYLLNTYTAKKLGLADHRQRFARTGRNSGHRPGKFFPAARNENAEEIIGDIKEGLFVTEFLGFGVNLVTGDFSRGASGLWISDGEFAFPWKRLRSPGNLKDMFFNISEIGNDLEFRSSIAARRCGSTA